MLSLKNKRAVEDKLWSALSIDRAKVQVGRISRFGLMEMSRQRLRPSLQERWTQDVASLSTAVLRLIEEEASKKKSGEVRAVVSSDMSTFLLNERRARVNEIEERTSVRVIVVSDPTRSDNRFEVTRLKTQGKKTKDNASYDIQSEIGPNGINKETHKKPKFEKPAVSLTPPKKPKKKGESFFKKLLNLFETKEESKPNTRSNKRNQRNRRRPENRNKKQQNRNNSRSNKTLPDKKDSDNKNQNKKRSKPNLENKEIKKPQNKNSNREKSKENKKDFEAQNSKPKSQTRKKVIDKKSKQDADEIQIKSMNKPSRKPKDDEVKKDITNRDLDIIQDNNKQKTSKADEKKSDKVENKNNEKSAKVKPLKNDKTSIEVSEKSKPDTFKETEIKENVKSAKDWGRASNDPRNKS